jgi:hypothetical protein
MRAKATLNVRRVGFFVFGFLVEIGCLWAGVQWPSFGEWLLGGFNFATQPSWFYIAGVLIAWLPWIVGAALVLVRISTTATVKPVSYIAGVVTSYVIALSFLLALPIVDDYSHRQAFDSQLWKASLADESQDPIKLRMVDDLLRKHPLAGRSRSAVLDLLGKPPRTDKFSDWDLVYWLGPERGLFSIDSEWLVIRFGGSNQVIDAKVVSD